jgi:hypothetical protein
MADTTPLPATPTVVPTPPLSAEAKAFRFWLCRLPWSFTVLQPALLYCIINSQHNTELIKLDRNSIIAFVFTSFFIFPILGFYRYKKIVLEKLPFLSTEEMKKIAKTFSLKTIKLNSIYIFYLIFIFFVPLAIIISKNPSYLFIELSAASLIWSSILFFIFIPFFFLPTIIIFNIIFFKIAIIGWKLHMRIIRSLKPKTDTRL